VNQNVPDMAGLLLHPDDVGGRILRAVEEEEKYLHGILGKEGEVHPVRGVRSAAGVVFTGRTALGGVMLKVFSHAALKI
jgi:hypothetical protein